MYNTYARVFNDESDEEEAAVSRLLRETASGRPPPVPENVLTSTGASRARTQQAVQQRRGGSKMDTSTSSTIAVPPAPVPSIQDNLGNLIDFGDDSEARARTSAAASSKQRNRGQSSQQVELVTLSADPFDMLVQQSASQPRPAPPPASAPPPSGPQPQHPLDLLYGPEPGRSGTAAGPGPGSRPGGSSFPAFGSFSDLLRPLSTGFGATSSTAAPGGAGSGPSASGANNGWGSFSGAGSSAPGPAPGPDGSSQPLGGVSHPTHRHLGHSQSTNGIDDLLVQERTRREAEAGGTSSVSVSVGALGHHKVPGSQQTNRAGDLFDPFSGPSGSGAAAAAANGEAAASASAARTTGDGTAADSAPGTSGGSFVIGSGGGEGYTMNHRELHLFAIPLFKDRLVFLPVVNWKEREDTSTVLGKVNAGINTMNTNLSHMWHSLKDKGEFSAKIYKAGQAILENMNAEERLMRNIPRKANKLVVHHPAAIPPDEIQDQLTQLTSNFCYKSAGKAAVAGVMLPVAVGLEVIAVPGIGWYTAYQLFKSTSAAAGGSRLNNYLKSEKSDVRVCYAPNTKMDLYQLKSRLNPDAVLGCEDIEDLCHDIREPTLLHPLIELRNRHLKKTQTTKADYALLPMSAPDVDEQYGSGGTKKKD